MYKRQDTGVESIAAACALPGLEAEGIFTHFAVSDEDDRDSEAYTLSLIHISGRTSQRQCILDRPQ